MFASSTAFDLCLIFSPAFPGQIPFPTFPFQGNVNRQNNFFKNKRQNVF